jgi:hypothetical protein
VDRLDGEETELSLLGETLLGEDSELILDGDTLLSELPLDSEAVLCDDSDDSLL